VLPTGSLTIKKVMEKVKSVKSTVLRSVAQEAYKRSSTSALPDLVPSCHELAKRTI